MDRENYRRDALACCGFSGLLLVGWLSMLGKMPGFNVVATGLLTLASGAIVHLLRRLPQWKDSDAQAWRTLRNRSCVVLMPLVTSAFLVGMNVRHWHSLALAALLFFFMFMILPILVLRLFPPFEALLASASLNVAESGPHRPIKKKRRR